MIRITPCMRRRATHTHKLLFNIRAADGRHITHMDLFLVFLFYRRPVSLSGHHGREIKCGTRLVLKIHFLFSAQAHLIRKFNGFLWHFSLSIILWLRIIIRTKYCQIRKGRDPAGSESRLDFVQNAREERMTNENHVNWIWDSHEVPEQKANKTHLMVSADFNLKRSDIKARFIAAASSISLFAHSDAVVAGSCANSNLYFSCKSNAFRIRALVFNSL